MNRFLPLILLFLAAIAAAVLLVPSSDPEEGGPDAAAANGGPEAGAYAGDGGAATPAGEAALGDDVRRDALADGAGAAAPATDGGLVEVRYADATGAPVAGLRVTLLPGDDSGFFVPAAAFDEAEPEGVLTDADGRVRLTVEPGESASVVASGDRWTRDRVRLQPLRRGERVDLGTRVVSPASLVQGVVYGADDQPLADAEVSLREGGGSGFGFPSHRARTAADGRYRLGGVAAGEYQATVSGPGHALQRIEPFAVPAAGEVDEDFRLQRGLQARGLVVDQDRNPVAGAELWVQGGGGGFYFLNRSGADGRPTGTPGAVSDRDGRFALDGLPDGDRARIVAWAAGFATASELFRGEDGELLIELRRHARFTGVLRDPDGAPAADRELRLEPTEREDWRFWMQGSTTRTDAEGRFAFESVQPGGYTVDASTPEASLGALQVDLGGDLLDQDLRMKRVPVLVVAATDRDGNPVEGARVGLRRHQDPGAGGASFSFDVAAAGDLEGISLPGHRLDRRTDADGLAWFAELEEGVYTLTVRAEGMATLERELTRGRGPQREELVLLPGADLRVRVVDGADQPIADVDVVLHDLQTGGERTKRSDLTGRAWWDGLGAGSYVVEARAGAGSGFGRLVVFDTAAAEEPEKPEPVGERVELAEGAQADLLLTIDDLALPEVLVTRGGVPVAGAEVELRKPQDDDGGWAIRGLPGMGGGSRTGADGRVQLAPVEPGKWELAVKPGAAAPDQVEEVELAAGARLLTVEVGGATVEGTVVTGGGPLAGARVSLQRHKDDEEGHVSRSSNVMIAMAGPGGEVVEMGGSGFGAPASVRSDADGSFRFEDVPAGDWRVVVDAPGYVTFRSEPLRSRGQGTLAVGACRVEQGGSIEGRVPELPAAGSGSGPTRFNAASLVRLEDADGNRRESTMARDGRYRFRDLAPGSYRVVRGDYKSPLLEVRSGAVVQHDIP